MNNRAFCLLIAAGALVAAAITAQTPETICDARVENCRARTIELIDHERVGIDAAGSVLADDLTTSALTRAARRGVTVRLIEGPDAGASHLNLILFDGQGVAAWSPGSPVMYFSSHLLPSWLTVFDDIWTRTGRGVRTHPTFSVDPRLNVASGTSGASGHSYEDRLVALIDREPQGGSIDVDADRVLLPRAAAALEKAASRGVRERFAAAASGIDRPNAVVFRAQHIAVLGTSTLSTTSNTIEANIFTTAAAGDSVDDAVFDAADAVFARDWSAAATSTTPRAFAAVASTTACGAVSLDATAKYVGAPEANWTITVTAPSSGCSWTATADASWLVVRSTYPSPPAGSGYVKVRAVTNTGPKRIGHFLIGGATFTVTQQRGSAIVVGWPNEPFGMTLRSDWGFDQTPPSSGDVPIPGSNGWRVTHEPLAPFQGNVQLGSDAGAPQSPPHVYDFVYPQGMLEGTAPATVYYEGFSAREVYAGFWWKASSPFDLGPNGNKVGFIFNGGGAVGGQQVLILKPDQRLHVMPEYPGDFRWRVPNVNATIVTLGVWHRVEWYSNVTTGTLKWWLDGVLQGSYTDVKNPVSFDLFEFSPTFGGNIGARKRETDHYWFDHVHLSTR